MSPKVWGSRVWSRLFDPPERITNKLDRIEQLVRANVIKEERREIKHVQRRRN